MKASCFNKLFLFIAVLIFFPSALVFSVEEAEPSWSDEYLAFEFFFGGTLQRQYEMLDGQRSPKSFYDTTQAILDYRFKDFSLFIDWSLINDELYDPSEVYLLGRYFYINDAHVAYQTNRFSLKAGRSTQQDVVDSPYSLFVNSEPIPAVQVEAKYTGDYFFYTNRWISLNHNSKNTYFGYGPDDDPYPDSDGYSILYPNGVTWADRGAHFHVYGLNLGDWRFGLQESAVTFGDSFSADFFFSPMIMYFTQLVMDDGAKPWQEFANSKHFMGFFLDKTTEKSYFSTQILIDDINGDILPGVENKNQNRLAWSIGGSHEFDFGRIGFFHAGATKDTFGATYATTTAKAFEDYHDDDLPVHYSFHSYPYTYYPAVSYLLEDDTTWMPIDYTQNYIGYKYGENNLSFLVDYENEFPLKNGQNLSQYLALEWVLNGAKSPANPWHEYVRWTHIPDPTQLLDGTVEQILTFRSRTDFPVKVFGVPFNVFADLEAGMIFNAMGLEPATEETAATEAWIYRPQEGQHEPVFRLTLGMGYLWRLK